jgi:threonine dehydrogenase-like Zn-dependent dehydrogenase
MRPSAAPTCTACSSTPCRSPRLTAYSTFDAQGEPGLESFRYAVRMIADGAIDVAPLLSHMLPIERVEEAFRIARERTGNALKVSIKF